MDTNERRVDARIKTNNLIAQDSFNDKGQVVSSCMGKALNISRSGILIESPDPIVIGDSVLLTTVDLNDNLIEIKGKPIYCRITDCGMYQIGISFIGSDDEKSIFVVKLIKLHHYRKHNLVIKVTA